MIPWTAVVMARGHDLLLAEKPVELDRVAGLSVLGRLVKMALHDQATRCCLVSCRGSNAMIEEARAAWSRSEGFAVVEVSRDTAETDALRAALSKDDQSVVVLFSDLSFSRNLLQGLIQDGLDDLDALVAVGEADRWSRDEDFHRPMGSQDERFAGIAMLRSGLADKLPSGTSLAAGLNQTMQTAKIRLRPMENSFTLRIQSPSDIKPAEKLQLQALRRNTDGLISQYLNRPVSLLISRYVFLRLPLRPNHITLIAAAVGWVGIGLVFWWPSYWWVLLGAFLFHLSSILDGCDGEIARLRYQFSRSGEWLDNVLDEINNAAFVAAIGVGSYRAGGSEILAWAAGFYCLAVMICDTAVFYQLAHWRGGTGNVDHFRWFFEEKKSTRSPNPTAYPRRRTLSAWLKELPRRDFYILLLFVLAAMDQLLVGFWIAVAFGVALFFLGILQWIYQIRSASRYFPTSRLTTREGRKT